MATLVYCNGVLHVVDRIADGLAFLYGAPLPVPVSALMTPQEHARINRKAS